MNPPPENAADLFDRALQFAPAERAAFLAGACGHDINLRRRVESLLAAHEQQSGFLPPEDQSTESVATLLDESVLTEGSGTQIGRYKLLEKLGEGGFGSVWAAEQREPVKRRVALKIIKLGMDTQQVVARFEAERQALALMDHPNIAKVLDAGSTDTGRPYFVMELVKGIPITRYCEQEKTGVAEKLDLFIKVCHAIQHAHQKGIIHRDIKPSNIMVTLHDGVPVPKVIDFGIAKATQAELTEKTIYTQYSQFIGTPAYMSPEQAEMSGLDIDTRSDIYSLGVLLYELLTGTTPFDTKELMQSGLDEMRKIIREREPVRPSTRLSQTNSENAERSTFNAQRSNLPSDLDWIVMKCLEKDRARRYDTANGLAMDLQRHLNNEPVVARPPSATYRLQKAWKRNKLAYSAAVAVAAALVIGIGVSMWQTSRAKRAEREQNRLREVAVAALNGEKVQRKEAERARTSESRLHQEAEARAYAADMIAVQVALEEGNLGQARHLLAYYGEDRSPAEDLRGFEWRYFWDQARGDELATLMGHSNVVVDVSFSPDNQSLASCSQDQTVRLWDLKSRKTMATLSVGWPHSLGFSPDGGTLLVGDYQSVEGFDIRKRESPVQTMHIPLGDLCTQIAVSSGKTLMAIGTGQDTWRGGNGNVVVWDYAAGRKSREFAEAGSRAVFSPDSTRLASGSWNGTVKLWNLEDGKLIRSFDEAGEVLSLSFSPDGKVLAASSWEGPVDVWDVDSGRKMTSLKGHTARVWKVAFAPGGSLLATTSSDQTTRLWDVHTWRPIRVLKGHGSEVWGLAFSHDGATLATGSKDETVKMWSPLPSVHQTILSNISRPAHFSPDGRTVATEDKQSIQICDLTTGLSRELNSQGWPAGFADSGAALAVITAKGTLDFLQLASGVVQKTTPLAGTGTNPPVVWSALSSNGKWLAVAQEDLHIRVWNAASGTNVAVLPYQPGAKWILLSPFSPDDRSIMGLPSNDRAIFWNIETGHSVLAQSGHKMMITRNAFSPDSRQCATGGADGVIKIWDVANGNEITSLTGLKEGISALAFSTDQKTLAAASGQTVKFWNTRTFRNIATIHFESSVDKLWFQPDGQSLIASCEDNTLRFLQGPSVSEREILEADREQTQPTESVLK